MKVTPLFSIKSYTLLLELLELSAQVPEELSEPSQDISIQSQWTGLHKERRLEFQ